MNQYTDQAQQYENPNESFVPGEGNNEGAMKAPSAAEDTERVLRDCFTIPASEYVQIERLRERCLGFAIPVTKSQLLRAGLRVLSDMSDVALLEAVQSLKKVKVGRPKSK
jgi:hypothetical protein